MVEKLIKKEPIGNGKFINVTRNHTFGTDAVLLADFSCPKRTDRLIDLGTGCGIIPFLIARDGKLATGLGVDISEEAIETAKLTAEEWQIEKLGFICSDLNELKGKTEFGRATLVTCNPPYKAVGAGIKNSEEKITAARHEIFCTLNDIVRVSAKLLQTSGRLCICQRPERAAELICLMNKYGVEPKRLRTVCRRQGDEPWLVMIEGKKCAHTGLRIMPTLYVENDGDWSDEMLKIYGPYKEAYLK